MKRFIDLRGQHTGDRFAWYDTVRDVFEAHGGSQSWVTWREFADHYEGNELERYRKLAPIWLLNDPLCPFCYEHDEETERPVGDATEGAMASCDECRAAAMGQPDGSWAWIGRWVASNVTSQSFHLVPLPERPKKQPVEGEQGERS